MATASPRLETRDRSRPTFPRPEVICGFNERAALSLADALGVPSAEIAVRRFPDNEACVRVADCAAVSGRHVGVYRGLNDPDAKIIELLLAASALRETGALTVSLIAPYLCYMRQDQAFHPGEAVSQRVVGSLFAQAFDALATVDPHLHRTHDLGVIFEKPALTLSAAPAVADYLRCVGWSTSALLLGPDQESAPLVRQIAVQLPGPWAVCRKVRQGDRGVQVQLPQNQNLARPIIIIDDVISTGATITALATALRQAGAGPIHVCTTHALFDEDDDAIMRDAGVRDIVSCDGVPHPSNRIPLARLIATGLSSPETSSRGN